MKKKAIFIGNNTRNAIDSVYRDEIKNKLFELVEMNKVIISRDNFKEHIKVLAEAEVAFSSWGMEPFSEDEINTYMPNLKVVFYAAGSVQSFARPFINCGVKVISGWAANAVPVSEYCAAQIILANKGYYQLTRLYKKRYENDDMKIQNSYPGNYNVKVGLIGVGMIGSKIIELLSHSKLDILVFDPYLSDDKAKSMNVRKTGLEEIFSTCQTISNHLANLPATVGMLTKDHFSRMLPNATFINTGRGAQVIENDLADAMREFPTRTALLDVTLVEPLERDSSLLKLDNVFLTPHIAGSNGDEIVRMAEYMLDEFQRYEKGEELKYNVTLKMLETMA